jgi:hypothetical protein
MTQPLTVLLLGMVLIAPRPAGAQAGLPDDGGRPAPLYVASIQGSVDLLRNGGREAVTENTALVPGDRVRTETGRAELRSDAGQVVYLDEASVVDISSETSIRVAAGSVRVVASALPLGWFRVDAPNATVTLRAPGDYRVLVAVGLRTDETEVRVRAGRADLATDRGSVQIGPGEASVARGAAAPDVPVAARDARDEFDAWTDTRASVYGESASSVQLPPQIASYGAVLDDYGTWAQEPEYGTVWYPSVPADWRPYAYGSWGYGGYYGSVWVGQGPWAWPTHHYGRWGWTGGRWFWVPGPVWGPAWVTWGAGDGYVGWCPLGWNDLPVFGFSVGVGYGSYGYYGRGGYGWGWTVVPSHYFRPGVPAWRHAVDHRGWGYAERRAFLPQHRPPTYHGGPPHGGDPAGGRAPFGTHYAVPRYGGSPAQGPRQPGTAPRGYTASRADALRQPYASRGPDTSSQALASRSSSTWQPRSSGTLRRGAVAPRTSRSYDASSSGWVQRTPGPSSSSRWMGSAPRTSATPGAAAAPRRFDAPSYATRSAPPASRSVPSVRSYGGGGTRGPSAGPPPSARGSAPRASGGGRTATARGGPGRR